MSKGVNRVILLGYVGRNPERSANSRGGNVTTFTLATNSSWIDRKTGNSTTKTQWHLVVVFGTLADTAYDSLRSGSRVYLEGKLRTDKWEDSTGVTHTTTKVVAHKMTLMS